MKKLFAAVLFIPMLAQAEFRTGNQLFSEIQSTGVVEQMISLGYIMGIADALRGINHCPPATVTAGQLRDMVKNYLDANPQFRHYTADTIVMAVLKQAWPCENKSKGTRL